MKIGIAADHGGFELKNEMAGYVREAGHEVVDFGADAYEFGSNAFDFDAAPAPDESVLDASDENDDPNVATDPSKEDGSGDPLDLKDRRVGRWTGGGGD